MGLEEIRKLKFLAKEPRKTKNYVIPKISAKRIKQIQQDKITLENDKDFYKEIYAIRPRVCQNCNCKLPKQPQHFMFHHLLLKSKRPDLRYIPENIIILCLMCHDQFHLFPDKSPKIVMLASEVEKSFPILQ